MTPPPIVEYSESFRGNTLHPLSNPVIFPSNEDGYQDMSVSTEPISYTAGPSLEYPSNVSAIDIGLANGSSGGQPQGHICPAGQVHHIRENVARLAFPCHDPHIRIALSSILY